MFSRCSELFAKGKVAECLSLLNEITFAKFDVAQWTKENNVIVCEVTQLFQVADHPRASELWRSLTSMEKLLHLVQGVPARGGNLLTELTVAHNLCSMRLKLHRFHQRLDSDIMLQRTVQRVLARVLQARKQTRSAINTLEQDGLREDQNTLQEMLDALPQRQLDGELSVPLVLLLCSLAMHRLIQQGAPPPLARDILRVASAILEKQDFECQEATTRPLSFLEAQLSDGSPKMFVNFLAGLAHYELGDRHGCIVHLKNIKSEMLDEHVRLLEAHSLLGMGQYTQCLQQLQDQLDNSQLCESHYIAQLYNLGGRCLAGQGKPHTALQSYKEALKADISCLAALYNISEQYRALGLYSAELEALSLLFTDLRKAEGQDWKSICRASSMLNLPAVCMEVVVHDSISPEHAGYALGKRCLELDRFEVASETYQILTGLLQDQARLSPAYLSPYPFHLPNLGFIQLEEAYSLVHCQKFQDVVKLCDRLIQCCGEHTCEQQVRDSQELGSFDLSLDADFDSSPRASLIVRTPSPSQLGISSQAESLQLNSEQFMQDMCDSLKEKFTTSGKRCLPEDFTDLGKRRLEHLHEISVAAHLYKAEGLVDQAKAEEALACIECCLRLLKLKESETKESNMKSRQKKSKLDAGIPGGISDYDEDERKGFSSLLPAFVYSLKSQLLVILDRMQSALHWSRLAVQMLQGRVVYHYAHCKLLMKLGRHKEASHEWLAHREMDVPTDLCGLEHQLQHKSNHLKGVEKDDTDATPLEQDYLHMDVKALEILRDFHNQKLEVFSDYKQY